MCERLRFRQLGEVFWWESRCGAGSCHDGQWFDKAFRHVALEVNKLVGKVRNDEAMVVMERYNGDGEGARGRGLA